MRCAIVWFRRDLRLRDNPALRAALDAAETVVPVYMHAPEEEGDAAPGAASRWWLHHSLGSLDASLRERDSRLIFRRGPSLDQLRDLIRETGAETVYWNRLYDPSVVERDRVVKEALREDGVAAESFKGTVLAEPWEVRSKAGDCIRVFTPFWKAFQSQVDVDAPIGLPRAYRPPTRWPKTEPLKSLGLLPDLDWAEGFHDVWTPGEAGALARLDRFIASGVAEYAEGRDRPAEESVSRLSPHLHFGEVSPSWVWDRISSYRGGRAAVAEGASSYLRELGWREFAHHILFHFPDTPREPMYAKYAAFPWRDPDEHPEEVAAWCKGMTGIPIVDAGMRQLWATGWMHNRVRMLAASFLVKNLLIPWQVGERWFHDTLVDADLANNVMGWQWTAGCGADAAPYFRIFNPVTQGQRFDPDGAYVKRWVPELSSLPAKHVHSPWTLPPGEAESIGLMLGRDYPEPMVDLKASRERALVAFKSL